MPIPAGGVVVQGYDEPTIGMEVLAAFGADLTADPATWSWTDLSSRLRAVPITMRAGKSGGAGRVSPGTCSVTLDNDDSALTPLHPMSPYWPDVELGTPIWVRLRRVEDPFDGTVPSGWGTAPSGHVWSGYGAGGTVQPGDQAVSGGRAHQSVPIAAAYRTSWLPDLSLLDCEVHLSGVSLPFSDVTGGPVEPGNILLRAQSLTEYYLARVEVTTTESVICRLYGPTGALLASATVPSLTHTASQTLEVVAEIIGDRLGMKVWATGGSEPAGWTVTATDSTLALPGGIGVRTGVAAGNTNTKPIIASYSSVTVRVDRLSGFADQWEPTFLPIRPGESASAVRVTVSGLLRRIGQGQSAEVSALRRTLRASSPVAYWPFEDGVDSSLVASGLVGGQPLRVVQGVVDFVDEGPAGSAGSAAMVENAQAVLSAPVSGPATGQWQASVWCKGVGIDSTYNEVQVLQVNTDSPTVPIVRLSIASNHTDPGFHAAYANVAGSVFPALDIPPPGLLDGGWHLLQFTAAQSGANVTVRLYVDGALADTKTVTSAATGRPVSISTLANVGQVEVTDVGVAHIALHSTATQVNQYAAGLGYAGEPATQRLARLLAEDGIALDMPVVDPAAEVLMGVQQPGSPLDLYRECETADVGILYESGFRLGYLPRAARYNRPVDMTVDLAAYCVTSSGEVLSPVYDDQGIVNQLTVERRDGSSVVAVDRGSQAHSGVYDSAVELNLASDDQLADQAGWRVHLGTVEELREGTFPVDLAANPGLIDGWLSCGVGSRVVRVNPPAQHRPGPLDRLVAGWTETIGPRSWMVQIMPEPAQPWDVATADGTQRAGADGSTLAAALSSSAMILSLASTAENGVWTTDPTDMPLDMRVGGEQVTASGITPAVADVFSRTVSNGWGTANSGQAWTTTGGAASDYGVSGGTGQHVHSSVGVLRHSFIAPGGDRDFTMAADVTVPVMPSGAAITVWAVVRDVDTSNYYAAQLGISPGGATTLTWFKRVGGSISSLALGVNVGTHAAGTTWRISAAVSGTTLMAKAWRPPAPDPGWQTTATDATITAGTQVGILSRLETGNTNTLPVTVAVDNFTVVAPQSVVLSARGVNGFTRAWPAGTPVDVWAPAIAPL